MIEDEIKAKLGEIEKRHDVTILMAIESGSRAWGFPSPNSDYDVRFVYAHNKDWYLQVVEQSDVIDLAINDDLDINGWDVKKALGLAKKGNAVLQEWLNSPIVYRACPGAGEQLRTTINDCFRSRSAFYHYFSQAGKFLSEVEAMENAIKLKKFFYLLRTLLCAQWIKVFNTRPPVLFTDLLNALVKEVHGKVYQQILQLVETKAQLDESGVATVPAELFDYTVALHQQLLKFNFTVELTENKALGRELNARFVEILNGVER